MHLTEFWPFYLTEFCSILLDRHIFSDYSFDRIWIFTLTDIIVLLLILTDKFDGNVLDRQKIKANELDRQMIRTIDFDRQQF